MANTKGKLSRIVSKRLVYLYLLLFPLGQLLRIETKVLGMPITVHPADLVVVVLLLTVVASKQKIPKATKYFYPFFLAASFSLVLSFSLFPVLDVFRGALFFIRLLAYFGLFVAVFNLSKIPINKKKISSLLTITIFFVALFGWVQYFLLPDLRWLRQFGWDDHLFRLVGTFLDPGFTGLILTFGFLISLGRYIRTKSHVFLLTTILFLVSVAFTYSRASYISLLLGTIIFLVSVNKRVKRVIVVLVLIFIVSIPLLPKPSSSGVQLGRLYSISSRIEYYKETFIIWKNAPVFGVGFNNICAGRQMFVKKDSYNAHSCSGSDSGILFILATTGVIGLITISGAVLRVFRNLPNSPERTAFIASAVALFAHSFFTNSLFYPWVLGFMAILFAITVSKESS